MSNAKALIPHEDKCGAKTRNGGSCRQVAGARTPHVGQGRCWLHGGLTPIKHGRYSTVKREDIRQLIEQHEADPDPLNILPELATARALFQDFIERYDQWREAVFAWHESWKAAEGVDEQAAVAMAKPRQLLDISDAYRVLSEVTKIVERIERIRAANAISRADLNRVIAEMGRVVDTLVQNEDVKGRIREGWLAIRV